MMVKLRNSLFLTHTRPLLGSDCPLLFRDRCSLPSGGRFGEGWCYSLCQRPAAEFASHDQGLVSVLGRMASISFLMERHEPGKLQLCRDSTSSPSRTPSIPQRSIRIRQHWSPTNRFNSSHRFSGTPSCLGGNISYGCLSNQVCFRLEQLGSIFG